MGEVFREVFSHSFDEFWAYKLQKYEAVNADAKQFSMAFNSDRVDRHRVLSARRTTRELRRLGRIGEGR